MLTAGKLDSTGSVGPSSRDSSSLEETDLGNKSDDAISPLLVTQTSEVGFILRTPSSCVWSEI